MTRGLHLRANPLNGLIMRLRQRAPMGREVVRDLLQCVRVRRARRDHLLDQSAPGCVDGAESERQDNIICEPLVPVLRIATRVARAHQPFRSRQIARSQLLLHTFDQHALLSYPLKDPD
jgi:hypothetical protein